MSGNIEDNHDYQDHRVYLEGFTEAELLQQRIQARMDSFFKDYPDEENIFIINKQRARAKLEEFEEKFIAQLRTLKEEVGADFNSIFSVIKKDVRNVVNAISPKKHLKIEEGTRLKKTLKASRILSNNLLENTALMTTKLIINIIPRIIIAVPSLFIVKTLNVICQFAQNCIRAIRWLTRQFNKLVSKISKCGLNKDQVKKEDHRRPSIMFQKTEQDSVTSSNSSEVSPRYKRSGPSFE